MLARRTRLATLLAPLLLAACIEDRLRVDVTTRIEPDGMCHRRVEYHQERFDKDKAVPIPPAEDPLRRVHRFPAGDRWTIRDEAATYHHAITLEATLASANEIDWDYLRVPAPKAMPARNYISFFMKVGEEASLYEYAERFQDPSSPMEAARRLAQIVPKKDGEFASAFARLGPEPRPDRRELKRLYGEKLALPLAQAVTRIAGRPFHGPKESQELEEALSAEPDELEAAIAVLIPGLDGEAIHKAVDEAMDAVASSVEKEMGASGLPLATLFPDLGERRSRIHFRVTLILPAPIVRANTCFQGDTATWEFDETDLYGHGFDMWARAAAP